MAHQTIGETTDTVIVISTIFPHKDLSHKGPKAASGHKTARSQRSERFPAARNFLLQAWEGFFQGKNFVPEAAGDSSAARNFLFQTWKGFFLCKDFVPEAAGDSSADRNFLLQAWEACSVR